MNPASAEPTGRKPPQAPEAEAGVLGAMLLDPNAVPVAIQYLKPEHFYNPAHGEIFKAVTSLFEGNSPTDVITVTSELKRMKQLEAVGGQPYLSGLLDAVITAAHCEDHARLVLEKAIQRQLIQTATGIVQESYDESRGAQELVEEAEQRIFEIRESGFRKQFAPIDVLLKSEWERVEKAMVERKYITGVETGFHDLDEKTSGLQAGELCIIAGRPSMGKTALALNIAVNASTRRRSPVAIFSLEMSAEGLTQRLLCSEASVAMNRLRSGHLNPEERSRLVTALGPLYEAQILIDDTPALTALDIRARARRQKADKGLDLIVIDYLQLMESHSNRRDRNRQQEISDITRGLKAMAKELHVPVVVLSQLSRLPEQRAGKRPELADLRESGAIEQDADLVLLLFRQEFYEPDNETVRGKAEVSIAKQRNGPLGKIELAFLGHCMRFENPYLREVPEPPAPGEYEDALPE